MLLRFKIFIIPYVLLSNLEVLIVVWRCSIIYFIGYQFTSMLKRSFSVSMLQMRAALSQQGAVGFPPGHVRALPEMRSLPWPSSSGDLHREDVQASSGQLWPMRSHDEQALLRQAHAPRSQDPMGPQDWSATSDRGELTGWYWLIRYVLFFSSKNNFLTVISNNILLWRCLLLFGGVDRSFFVLLLKERLNFVFLVQVRLLWRCLLKFGGVDRTIFLR